MTQLGHSASGPFDRHAERVRERKEVLRLEHPEERGPDGNWQGYAYAEHEPGECIECDALRELAKEDDQ